MFQKSYHVVNVGNLCSEPVAIWLLLVEMNLCSEPSCYLVAFGWDELM